MYWKVVDSEYPELIGKIGWEVRRGLGLIDLDFGKPIFHRGDIITWNINKLPGDTGRIISEDSLVPVKSYVAKLWMEDTGK